MENKQLFSALDLWASCFLSRKGVSCTPVHIVKSFKEMLVALEPAFEHPKKYEVIIELDKVLLCGDDLEQQNNSGLNKDIFLYFFTFRECFSEEGRVILGRVKNSVLL